MDNREAEQKELEMGKLEQVAGGKEAPLVRITCPKCLNKWETKLTKYVAKYPSTTCGYEFWLDYPGVVEILEKYD